jgi:hypothetical protein
VIHRPDYHVDRSPVSPITELLRLARCFQLLESSIRLAEVGSPNHHAALEPRKRHAPPRVALSFFPFIGDAIRRRATAADIATKLGNHSFRATGIPDNVRSTLYATWELAEMGHRRAVLRVRNRAKAQ